MSRSLVVPAICSLLLVSCSSEPDGPKVVPYVDAELSVDSGLIKAKGKSDALSGVIIGPVRADATRSLLSFSLNGLEKLSIRIDRRGHEPEWRAPHNLNAIPIKKGESATVTIYGRAGYAFEMENLSFVACQQPYPAACLLEGDIRDIAKAEGVDTPKDENRLVASLTNWVSNTSDFSLSASLAKVANQVFPPLNAAQIKVAYYDTDSVGGFCGATAVYAAKVLREFGVDAFTVNFGLLDDDLTHVTVVCRSRDGKFHFADPTFNGSFYRDGQPADIFADLASEEFSSQPNTKRDYLFRPGENEEVLSLFIPNPLADCKPNDGADLLICRRSQYSLEDYFGMFSDKLSKHNLKSGRDAFLYLFRQGIFSVGDGRNEDTEKEFLRIAAEHGLPIHR